MLIKKTLSKEDDRRHGCSGCLGWPQREMLRLVQIFSTSLNFIGNQQH